MKKIQLSGSFKVALLDDADYEAISQFSWKETSQGYATRFFPKKSGLPKAMHQFVLPPRGQLYVDHINGNKLDNRRSNLRYATHHDNLLNSSASSTKRHTRHKGVTKTKGGRWMATITFAGCRYHLGTFSTDDEAAAAYNHAARRLHGAYARLNAIW